MCGVNRRSFLKSMGFAVAGMGFPALAAAAPLVNRGVFPSVDPADVDVDALKLEKVVKFIDAEVKAGSVPGAVLVATRRGKTFIEHYSGTYRNGNGEDLSVHAGVSHPVFSFSKGISATVAAMVHQDGLIDYDVPVSTYIPEFKGGGKEPITLRHLMTHSAGIPSVADAPVGTEQQWREFVKKVCDASIEWPVGSKTQYHGVSGMFVVGEAVRRVSDMKPWNAICRERLFAPIGAHSMSFGELPPDYPAAVAPSYFQKLENYGLAGHPAGGCFGTVEDMLRVVNLIVQGGTWEGRSLIKPQPLKEMLTVQYADEIAKAAAAGKMSGYESWGLGWLVRGNAPQCPSAHWFGFGDSNSPTLFGHAGVETCYGDGDPARELAFVFLMTDKPENTTESLRLRAAVSNLLQDAVIS